MFKKSSGGEEIKVILREQKKMPISALWYRRQKCIKSEVLYYAQGEGGLS